MALTPNFTSTEDLYSNNLVTFNDTSTGSDGTITVRHISILLADGSYLVPAGTSTNYIIWDYANSSILLNLLTKSTSATVKVEWFADPTQAAVYTLTQYMIWDLYDYVFLFGLLGSQTSKPIVVDDIGYWPNSWYMCTNLFQAEQAIVKMNDTYSSQGALDRNQDLIDNQSKFF
ncbi:MAG TPA: hypothetical protein VN698_00930 [Bacteroidia bacterium]|nr:hypothetical protein [Bacteroidia bacterium]